MKATDETPYIEPRWHVDLVIVAVILLLAALPGRVRLFPACVPYAAGVAVLAPMFAVALGAARARWLRVEAVVTLAFFIFAAGGTIGTLAFPVLAMVHGSTELRGLQLLNSSIAVWVMNVLIFSLLFWQIDRGGPSGRVRTAGLGADWLFPQQGSDSAAPDWRPGFVDHRFLGYSTATSFSASDALPLTARAKLLMMFESAIWLVTIVVVAARAINILGSLWPRRAPRLDQGPIVLPAPAP